MRAADDRSWRADRIVIAVGCRAAPLPVPGGELALTYQDIWTLKALPQQLTIIGGAVGWPANLQNLDLDSAAVTSSPRAIPVDDYLQTNVEHIFAAGDVNGRSKLVQSARLEGRIAARNAVHGPTRRPGHDVVAAGSFTDPEYGSVGLTEGPSRP